MDYRRSRTKSGIRTGTDIQEFMTGIGTVLADNPLLTCRIEGGKNPIRIICDTSLRTPLDSKDSMHCG